MKKKKLNLLYNADFLRFGTKKDSHRSGIYYTALNLLKEFVKKDNIDITLFTMKNYEKDVKKLLKEQFPDIKFKLLIFKNIPAKANIDNLAYICSSDRNFVLKYIEKLFIYLHYFINKLFMKLYLKIISLNNFDVSFSAKLTLFDKQNELRVKNRYTFLHDVIPLLYPHYFKEINEHWFEDLVSTINEKDYYFTNSEYTRKDFLKHVPVTNPEKIISTYVGCNVLYNVKKGDLERVKIKYNIPDDKKYVFSLCSLEPRKNLIRTVQTFIEFTKKHNINDLILVMGGGNWKSFINKLNNTIKDLNTDKIIQIGYVDDEDLPVLYSGAEWFTYTSEYEGFGSPVLEAMTCGCPVITSNNSSLPEVVGNAGITIDYDSDEQHIEAYEKYYFDENLRKENSKKGLERSKLFSWEKTADKMLDIMMKNNELYH